MSQTGKVINYGRQTKKLTFKVEAKGISTNEQGQEVGKIEAYGAIYNNVDEGNDRILPGAFARTVKNSKSRAQSRDNPYIFKMLWNHNQDELIGGWYDIDPNDPKGLHCWGDVLLSTQRGREYYDLALAKMADEFSIIYDVIRGEKDNPGARYDEKGVRELMQLRLFTIDPVVLAMNDETYTIAVKSSEGKSMDEKDKPPQRKTLLEHYNDAMARDLLEDWKDTFLDPLTCALFDAFTIGDQPQEDISQALDDFKQLVVSKFVPVAIECNLSQYLSDNGYSYTPGLSQMLDGSDDSYYGYMSHRSGLAHKAGKPISAANQSNIDDHVTNLHDTADKGMKALKQVMQHMKAVHTQADTFASTMSGDKPEPDDEKPEGKSLEDALTLLKGLRTNR